MEHIRKIHEEFNMIQRSVETFQYWRGKKKSITLMFLRATFASKTGAPRGAVLVADSSKEEYTT